MLKPMKKDGKWKEWLPGILPGELEYGEPLRYKRGTVLKQEPESGEWAINEKKNVFTWSGTPDEAD